MELRNQVNFISFIFHDDTDDIGILIVNISHLLFLIPQCRIIRTTELAAAQEKLHELERQKEEILKFYSPASLLRRLQGKISITVIWRFLGRPLG